MPFFADEDDSRQDVFSLLRRVFACSDPLSWPFQRWIRAEPRPAGRFIDDPPL